MSLPQIGRRQFQQQGQQQNIQSLLEMNNEQDIPENERIKQRNPKNLQSKAMTEIFGGRQDAQQTPFIQQSTQNQQQITQLQPPPLIQQQFQPSSQIGKRPGSRPDTGNRQKLNNFNNFNNFNTNNAVNNMKAPQSANVLDVSDGGQSQMVDQQQISYDPKWGVNRMLPSEQMSYNKKQVNYNGVDKMISLYESQDVEIKEKIQTQERVMAMLIDQLTNVERSQQGELKKHKMQLDNERDYRVKLEANLRFIQDQYNQLNHELQTKVELLDSKQQREERNKTEMKEKLILTEQNQKEILFFIRNMQKSETSEIISLRGMMQDKMTEESLQLQKEREKSKALFMEVVRLGETQERQNETFNSLQGQFETRVAILETQLNAGQRSFNQIAQKGDQGISYISDWNEKLERRLQQAESNFLLMSKEQMKDREVLSQLENYHMRMAEDVKQMLLTMSTDYDQKLDSKVSEVINRIMVEHDDRTRSNDEIRNNIDIRDKLNQEKNNYEREEMRERYSALDTVMRTEFQRKDESIKSLQAIVENQVRGLQNAIKFEEQSRNQQEILFRNEMLKLQETFGREYDIFKNQQSNITEKITEMMKIEIQTRLSSDVDLKNLTSAIATDIVSDVNSVKDQLELQYKKVSDELKEMRLEGSQRSEQVSRYVDEEVKKIVDVLGKKHEKTKTMFTKLAEQFKNHLVNMDGQRKDSEKRLNGLEKGQEETRNELYKLVGDTQKAFENRLVEEKLNLELQLETQSKGLLDKVNLLEEENKKDVLFLREALEIQRESTKNKIDEVEKKLDFNHRENSEKTKDVESRIDSNAKEIARVRQDTMNFINEFQTNIISQVFELQNSMEKMQRNLSSDIEMVKSNIFNVEEELVRVSKEVVDKLNQMTQLVNQQATANNERFTDNEQTDLNLENLIDTVVTTIEGMQTQLENKILEVSTQGYLDSVNIQVDTLTIKQELQELFELMNGQHSDIKTAHARFESLISKNTEDLESAKTLLHYELEEQSDKKIQKVLENIKAENQRLWQQNVEIASSENKQIDDLRNNSDKLQTQLNEILVTQDNYSKPKLKPKQKK